MLIPASRAIVFDLCGPGQESMGNIFISIFVGVGNMMSYIFVAFVNFPYFYGIVMVIIMVLPTLIFGKEQQYVKKEKKTYKLNMTSIEDEEKENGKYLCESDNNSSSFHPHPSSLPLRMRVESHVEQCEPGSIKKLFWIVIHIFVVRGPILFANLLYLLCWLSLFSFLPLASSFMGEVVFKGDPHSFPVLYEKGVKMGAVAMIISSFFTTLFSISSVFLIEKVGMKKLFFFTQSLTTLSFLVLYLIPYKDSYSISSSSSYPPAWSIVVTIVVYVLGNLNITLIFAVPFIVVSECIPLSDSGLHAGILNCFCVTGETATLLLSSFLTYLLNNGADKEGGITNGYVGGKHVYQYVLLVSCIISFITSFFIIALKRNKSVSGSNNNNYNKEENQKEG